MQNELAVMIQFNKDLLDRASKAILLRVNESGVSGLPSSRDVLALEVKERETLRLVSLLKNIQGERTRTEAQVVSDLRDELAQMARSALRAVANGHESDWSSRADASYAERLLATFRELR